MKSPRFKALGGGDEIGASCYHYKFSWPKSRYGYLSVIVDCGMRPHGRSSGPKLEYLRHVDVIIITHAHADHCVFTPVLVRMFPEAVIYMTPETYDLFLIQMEDSVAINMRNAKETGEQPLFTKIDVERMLMQIKLVPFWHRIDLPAGVSVLPVPAGHILGAASLYMKQDCGRQEHSIFHSGDISFENQCLIPGAPKRFYPNSPINTGVLEATNLHSHPRSTTRNRKEEENRLIEEICEVLGNGGRAVIPVLKIHRQSEMWEMLVSHGIPQSKIFIDGNPSKIFEIYQKHTSISRLPESQIIHHWRHDRWKMWRKNEPCVILASGGMMQERSAALENARMVIENENDALFVVNYMDPCSPGGELLDHIARGKKEIEIGLERFDIRCRVERFPGLSSHAGNDDLLDLAERARDRVIWIHGEDKRVKKHLASAPGHHVQGKNGKGITL